MGFTEEEFSRLYRAYSQAIFKLTMVYLGSEVEAEDVVQEVFIRFLQTRPTFASTQKEKSWMLKVAANLCKDKLKSSWRKRVLPLDSQMAEALAAPEPEGLRDDVFWQTVWTLPDKYKGVIHLHYYEGYPVKEISNILGLTQSAVKMRLVRGRQLLQVELAPELGGLQR